MPKAVMYFALLLVLTNSIASAVTHGSGRELPAAPTRVIAVALTDAAIVAWLLPESSSDAEPITGYTISAFDSDAPQVVAVRAQARAAGVAVHRLTGGHCYSFTVHARNAAGNGPESEPSEPVCLPATGADIALTMTAPASASPGSVLAFSITVTNNGPSDAALVNVVDALPAPLASFTTTQGVCHGVVGGSDFGCNLGALLSGASATVTVMETMGNTDISNTAWASAHGNDGAPLADPLPGNNAGSATVSVGPSAGN